MIVLGQRFADVREQTVEGLRGCCCVSTVWEVKSDGITFLRPRHGLLHLSALGILAS